MVFNLGTAQLGIDTLGGPVVIVTIKPQGGSMPTHDFKAFPELRKDQLDELYWLSPHKQIFNSFKATVTKVHDGDTITVSTTFRDFEFPIRFGKIDTKELSEGGNEAEEYTRARLSGKTIDVIVDPNNRVGRYGRLIGEIMVDGINLNTELVQLGLALPFGQRGEGKLPNLDKELNTKKWF